jgi:hypothetical protein
MVLKLTNHRIAAVERIARMTLLAGTAGRVIDDLASGVQSTQSWTRVCTLVSNTHLILGTFRIYCTLWSAIGRCADIVWQTRASFTVSDHLALGIRTTRRRAAEQFRTFGGCHFDRHRVAP